MNLFIVILSQIFFSEFLLGDFAIKKVMQKTLVYSILKFFLNQKIFTF